ncbi:MAG: acetyl-CoA carboxylase carboxyl transferase subunit alpha, partial [Clostridia bacterium]|nr:acetyl-CoA carboxylase carboxyl transferase subunit alpha [Clostridia bacterium]
SVISPEGCASILWKDAGRVEEAAEVLHITADDMKHYGVAEEIIREDFGDFHAMCASLGARLHEDLENMAGLSPDQLSQSRYERFRKFGIFCEA